MSVGLGGGAARIVLPKGQPPSEEGGSTEPGKAEAAEEPTSSGEKRKAEAEAQGISTKRRPSPEAEVIVLLLLRPVLREISGSTHGLSHFQRPMLAACSCLLAGPEDCASSAGRRKASCAHRGYTVQAEAAPAAAGRKGNSRHC